MKSERKEPLSHDSVKPEISYYKVNKFSSCQAQYPELMNI